MAKEKTKKFKTNPFRETMIRETMPTSRTIYGSPTQKDTFAFKSESGETVDVAFGKRIVVDKTTLLKIYANFHGLGSAGTKVFMVIFDLLMGDDASCNKDSIILQYDFLSKEAQKQISRTTLYRGINELKKAKILASSTVRGVYWINAAYVLRGNRFSLINQYELV